MNICNDEPFIKLNTAAKAYFGMELWVEDASEKHFEHLQNFLDLYVHIYGICNIYPAAGLSFESDGVRTVAKNINGMCEVLINHPTYEALTYSGAKPSVYLTVSPFIESIATDLVGSDLIPVDNHINYNNYLGFSFVQLSEFINHAKDANVEINSVFLAEIILDDCSFRELKRSSNKDIEDTFNLKEAANRYIKYFKGVPEKTIIQACKYASDDYDRQEKALTESSTIKSNMDNIVKLFNETPITQENIEQLSSNLPDAWRDTLFKGASPAVDINEQPLSLEDEDTPDKLYLTLSVYKAVWQDFNPETTNLPKREQVENIVKIMGVSEPKDIEAIIRLSIPEGLEFGKRPNSNKESWLPLTERNAKEVIN